MAAAEEVVAAGGMKEHGSWEVEIVSKTFFLFFFFFCKML